MDLNKVTRYQGIDIFVSSQGQFIFWFDTERTDSEQAALVDAETADDYQVTTNTLEDAQKKLDHLRLTRAKQKPLNLPVVTRDGVRTNIVSVHGRVLNPILKPIVNESRNLYPTVRWVEDMIRTYLDLRRQIDDIGSVLSVVMIDIEPRRENGTYIHSGGPDEVQLVAKQFEKNHSTAVKLAEKFGSFDAALKWVKKKEADELAESNSARRSVGMTPRVKKRR